jgi:hypothetical protein
MLEDAFSFPIQMCSSVPTKQFFATSYQNSTMSVWNFLKDKFIQGKTIFWLVVMFKSRNGRHCKKVTHSHSARQKKNPKM